MFWAWSYPLSAPLDGGVRSGGGQPSEARRRPGKTSPRAALGNGAVGLVSENITETLSQAPTLLLSPQVCFCGTD